MTSLYNVLFLCTGNSARSIMAEALLNHWGRGRFQAFSAGSHPKGEVHPTALETLRRFRMPVEHARSKSWDEFARPGAPPLNFVFTVCDRAAEEVCPFWPGQPMTAHWGIADPAAIEGSDDEKQRAFQKAFRELDARIKIFTSLRLELLDRLALQKQLDDIGLFVSPRCIRRRLRPGTRPLMETSMLSRRLVAESLGTAFLLTAVVGSGIMGERLAGGNVAIALLANTIATGAALVALILTFGPISGAHFNPVVSLSDASQGGIAWSTAFSYVVAQCLGAVAGVALADAMFGEPLFAWSTHVRSGFPQWLSEGTATFGLLAVIWSCARRRSDAVPFAVGAYITAAYWFTASTSFANPAVTLARSLTNTFAGIRPADTGGFIVAQVVGAALATVVFRWLVPTLPTVADRVVVPHDTKGA